jgi:hypothetical protein
MRIFYLLAAAAVLSACASEPVHEPARSTPPAPVAAPEVAGVPASASAVATIATLEKPESPSSTEGEFVPPAGYKVKKRGNSTVYCKTDTPIGTRFGNEYCYTQSDLERMEASRVYTKQDVDRARRTCTGGGCGGG